MAHVLPDGVIHTDGKWSDLSTRFLSAAILGPIALFALWFGGLAWALLITACLAGLGFEWARLAARPPQSWIAAYLAVIGLLAATLGTLPAAAALALFTLLVARRDGAFAAAGLPYAGLGGLSLLWLRLATPQGLNDTLFLVLIVWGTDIGAYAVGRVVGGKKLAPQISPGKTWSGSIGGLLIGGLIGGLMASLLHADAARATLAALALSIAAQAGDLAESAIKRKLGVKDSGTTIPGHGGLFDRLDGFLAAAPLAALWFAFAQGGVPLWR